MIYLSDIRDFLKTVFKAEHYYIGKLDNKQDKSLGVYSLKQSGAPVRAIGDEYIQHNQRVFTLALEQQRK